MNWKEEGEEERREGKKGGKEEKRKEKENLKAVFYPIEFISGDFQIITSK